MMQTGSSCTSRFDDLTEDSPHVSGGEEVCLDGHLRLGAKRSRVCHWGDSVISINITTSVCAAPQHYNIHQHIKLITFECYRSVIDEDVHSCVFLFEKLGGGFDAVQIVDVQLVKHGLQSLWVQSLHRCLTTASARGAKRPHIYIHFGFDLIVYTLYQLRFSVFLSSFCP